MSDQKAIRFINISETVLVQPVGFPEKGILAIVQGFIDAGQECWVTDRQFGEAMGIHPTTINRTIRKLLSDGYLDRVLIRTDVGTPRRLTLGDSYYQNAKRLLANRQEAISKLLRGSYQIANQIETNRNKSKEIESASALAPAHTDTAIADPVTPLPQTTVELEQATEQERTELEKTSPLKKLKKEKRKIGSLEELDLTPEVRAAADRWMNHKRTIGKPIKLPKLIAEVKKYGGGLPGVVQRSINQGWTGLFPLPKIAPWVRASSVASDWISAVGKFDPAKPGTGKASEEVINANPGLKEIILKIRDKEQIRKSSDFVTRIKQDEFFRNRIEKSIKEELTVVLTSGIGGK
jgi:DNA-binding Lrp family transcriptional regulator